MVTLDDFIGNWDLARDIRHADGGVGLFTGQANWRREGAGAVYTETGTLDIPGQGRFAAERRYLWAPDLSICFDDGRFFHQVPAAGGAAAHWCDPDQYDVTYMFADWPRWSCTWQVKGPRKNYAMTSRYSPAG
ncbi:DUF6314 family protein [Tropicibacter oceani]|uniref:DUF6314 family protein n=1 Tax=Tropicibacter oceani TaxID=3058420 RepID=A0ABY8QF48_9RHOB|nr:DUF6314 family protein [Tropicibacter oceani]WGW03247.1 DUF6314 family protein [Tropicibacter oceani]